MNVTLISWYSVLNKIPTIRIFFFLLYSFNFIFKISIYLNSILQTSYSDYRFNLYFIWILIINLISCHNLIILLLFILNNIICYLTERFTINILWMNFLYMTTVSRNVTYLIVLNYFYILLLWILYMITSISLYRIFYFVLLIHLIFKL